LTIIRRVRSDLPTGTVTFLFTDVEGSTRLLHDLGDEDYADVLAEHRRVLREAFAARGGVEVDTQGDAFFIVFPTAPGALRAAAEARGALTSGPIRVRMGIHTGTPHVGDAGYIGGDVRRATRIAAAGHGGQVLVSASTASLVDRDELRDLGEHRLKDLSAPERLYQLGIDEFPPLKSLHHTNLPVPATEEMGVEVPWVTRMNDETQRRVREQLDEDAVVAAQAEGRALTVDEAAVLASDACRAAGAALAARDGGRH
jgi:class 3 adenylate cyclase